MITDQLKKFLLDDTLPLETKKKIVGLLRLNSRGRKDITVFAREMLGVPLNDFQEKYLRQTTTPRALLVELGLYRGSPEGMLFGQNIAFPSNQVGKTVMIAIKHLWFNYYKIGMDIPGALFDKTYYATLNISPHTRQVRQCSNYTSQILAGEFLIEEEGNKRLNQISPLLKGFLVGFNSTIGEMRFSNGAIFYSVPVGQDQAASLAGGQFGYISYDECAQSHHLQNELGAKIMSRLIKYGVGLDLISTAEVDAPSHQYYHRICTLGEQHKDLWWAMGGFLDQNIYIPTAQRNKIKANLLATDKKKYQQVVHGKFVTGGKRFFDQAEIDQLWKLQSRKTHQKGHLYLVVADWGMSDTGDPSEFAVLDYTRLKSERKIEVAAWESTQGGSPHAQFAILKTLMEEYTEYHEDGITVTPPAFLMDANALGGVVIKKLLSALRPKGFDIDKDEALLMLKNEMSAGRSAYEDAEGNVIEENPEFGNILCYFIQDLADQLGTYHVEDAKLKQDKVMTLMMGVAYLIKKYQPRRDAKPVSQANISRHASWNRSVRPIHRVRNIRPIK